MPRLKSSSPRFSAILRTSWTDCWPMRCALGRSINPFAGLRRRTWPPSWSTAIKTGRPAADLMLAVSAESCSGELMLRSPLALTSLSKRITLPILPSDMACRKGSPGARLVPRKPSISMLPIICSMGGVSSGLYCRGLAWSARAGASRQSMRITATGIIFDILFSMANPSSGAILPFSAAHLPGWPVCPCLCQG